MKPKDKLGKVLKVGDTVVFGYDNGSSLMVSTIVKFTPLYVWMKKPSRKGHLSRRYYDRVVKLK